MVIINIKQIRWNFVTTPLWGKCEDETRTPKSGNLESSRTPETWKLNFRGQTPCPEVFLIPLERSWSVDVENGLASAIRTFVAQVMVERRARSQTANSQPLKVRNRPDPSVCRWSATHRWKDLKESYKFALDLIPIQGLSWELWAPKVPGVQTGIVSGLLLGSPEIKSHSDVGVVEQRREYYMREGGGFPWVRAMVSQVNLCCPWLIPTPRVIPNVN
jgi:hypothetical protein